MTVILASIVPLILFNKPFQVLSQFSDDNGRATLADYVQIKSVYPAGRLDYDSEGLILLTDDGALQARISAPKFKLLKSYWVQVEGIATSDHTRQLIDGVQISGGPARARGAELIDEPSALWPRTPPIRERKNIPTSWISVQISEGRNRQIRKMTAAAGLPALRLIRNRIGPWALDSLQPGEHCRLETEAAWTALKS